MTAGYDPDEVPFCPDQGAVERAYATAEEEGEPFFAVERYEEGFGITYDLLPAGSELAEPALSELEERVTRDLERIVGDDRYETTEVGRSISDSLGQLSTFAREDTAREVAATVSTIVLDSDNWVAATPPSEADTQFRQN